MNHLTRESPTAPGTFTTTSSIYQSDSDHWTAAPDGESDAAVVTNTAIENKQSIRTFYDGWGGWRWRWGGGTASTVVEDYQVGTLVVDIFDTRTKQAIWRGSCSGEVSRDPHPDGRKVQKAVTKMFNGFPPSD